MKNIRHSVVLVAVVAFVTLAAPSVASTAGAATVPTRHLTASGGTIEWTTTVHNAQWCEWSSSATVTGFDATVRCKSGTVTRSATFTANTSSAAKYYTLSLTVLGQTKTVEYLKVVEAPTGAGSTQAVPTRHLPASGGKIKWTVAVHNAKTCTWSSSPTVAGFDGTVPCTNGRAVRPATFKTNIPKVAKDHTLTVVIRGVTVTVDHLKVVQAAGRGWPLVSLLTACQYANTVNEVALLVLEGGGYNRKILDADAAVAGSYSPAFKTSMQYLLEAISWFPSSTPWVPDAQPGGVDYQVLQTQIEQTATWLAISCG
jgi:hypothetical protein